MKQLWQRFWSCGPALMCAAAFCFVLMAGGIKAVGQSVPLYEVVFVRSAVSVVILGVWLYAQGLSCRMMQRPLLLGRSLAGALSICCNFYGLRYLSLADGTLLIQTFPLFVALLSICFLSEKPGLKLWLLILLAWVGIALILRPHIAVMNYAGFIALLGAVFSAIDVVTTHVLRRSMTALVLTFYMLTMATVLSLPLMLHEFIWPTQQQFFYLLVAGVAGTAAQTFAGQAYGLGHVSRLAPLSYVSVLFAFILDAVVWLHSPTWLSLLGAALLVAACTALMLKPIHLRASPLPASERE